VSPVEQDFVQDDSELRGPHPRFFRAILSLKNGIQPPATAFDRSGEKHRRVRAS